MCLLTALWQVLVALGSLRVHEAYPEGLMQTIGGLFDADARTPWTAVSALPLTLSAICVFMPRRVYALFNYLGIPHNFEACTTNVAEIEEWKECFHDMTSKVATGCGLASILYRLSQASFGWIWPCTMTGLFFLKLSYTQLQHVAAFVAYVAFPGRLLLVYLEVLQPTVIWGPLVTHLLIAVLIHDDFTQFIARLCFPYAITLVICPAYDLRIVMSLLVMSSFVMFYVKLTSLERWAYSNKQRRLQAQYHGLNTFSEIMDHQVCLCLHLKRRLYVSNESQNSDLSLALRSRTCSNRVLG